MVYLTYHLSNLLFFGIPVLYYYISLNSPIIFCLSFGETYLSFGISLLTSFDCISSFRDFFDALVTSFGLGFAVMLSAILLSIKSPVASAVFLNCSF